jgi:hypothetical protein
MTGIGRMSRFGLAVVVVIVALVLAGCVVLSPPRGLQVGGALLMLYVLLSRLIFTGDHQLALWHLAHQEYELAIPRLEASHAYFSRRRWLDALRFVLLLSPTGYRYREMAMLGLGFCHAQLGHTEALDWYAACLRDHPRNPTAKAALSLMHQGAVLGRRAGPGAAASGVGAV